MSTRIYYIIVNTSYNCVKTFQLIVHAEIDTLLPFRPKNNQHCTTGLNNATTLIHSSQKLKFSLSWKPFPTHPTTGWKVSSSNYPRHVRLKFFFLPYLMLLSLQPTDVPDRSRMHLYYDHIWTSEPDVSKCQCTVSCSRRARVSQSQMNLSHFMVNSHWNRETKWVYNCGCKRCVHTNRDWERDRDP